MTVINNIEIDDIKYCENEIKSAINNNEPIEDKLHVIIVISNPCQYGTRYLLAREFVRRMELDESNVELYIVELAYNDQQFYVTEKSNKKHLQIRTKTAPLWHKENMINLGVKYLLPKKWKAFAWVDADVEFENVSWNFKELDEYKKVLEIVKNPYSQVGMPFTVSLTKLMGKKIK